MRHSKFFHQVLMGCPLYKTRSGINEKNIEKHDYTFNLHVFIRQMIWSIYSCFHIHIWNINVKCFTVRNKQAQMNSVNLLQSFTDSLKMKLRFITSWWTSLKDLSFRHLRRTLLITRQLFTSPQTHSVSQCARAVTDACTFIYRNEDIGYYKLWHVNNYYNPKTTHKWKLLFVVFNYFYAVKWPIFISCSFSKFKKRWNNLMLNGRKKG